MAFKRNSSDHSLVQRYAGGAPRQVPPSVLASDLKIVGTILSLGTIMMDGTVEGEIQGVHITVGERGCVQGTVHASEIVICGRTTGDLCATAIKVRAQGEVEGTLACRTLSIDMGALLNGHCRHLANPVADIAGQNSERAPQPSNGSVRRVEQTNSPQYSSLRA